VGAAGFVEHQRVNRRATVVVLVGVFVLLGVAVNAVAAALGGYTESRCAAPRPPSYAPDECTTAFVFRPVVLAGALSAVAVYLVVAYFASGRAALALSHARRVTPDTQPRLCELVDQMALAAGIPTPDVYVVDDPAPNAFATGRNPDHAAVTVTTGLLAALSHRELRGVVAHELAHIKNRDIAVTTLAVLAVGLIALLAQLSIRLGAVVGRSRDSGQVGLLLVAVGAVMFLLAVPAGLVLKAALSRRREALADATAVEFTREPVGLRSALEKLEADTTVLAKPSPAVAHLWIESPLQRGAGKGLVGVVGRMFDTHPPLADRISLLRGYEGLDPAGRGPNDPRPVPANLPPPPSGPAPPPASRPPAGWYQDPANAGQWRWWDGAAWSPLVGASGVTRSEPLR
jgi:heat shock protein HtpX